MENRIEVYLDEHGEWRWRVVAAENGEIIGGSTEGYVDHRDAVANIERLGLSGEIVSL